MQYDELLVKLFALRQGTRQESLDSMREFSRLLDHPEKAFRSVHVAGTNGKGSVSLKIAKGLERSGFKTGLYTSPHLSCFRERILINSQKVTEKEVETHLNALFKLSKDHSFFDITTLLAFSLFRERQVDIAVIETGLGGRLDATNIIQPELAIITSISFDHTEILGNTLEEITKEKGGIIKQGVPCLVGPRVPMAFLPPVNQVQGRFTTYDEENSLIARAAMQTLNLPPEPIQWALQHRPSCRFEQVGPALLDVAHNPDGLTALKKALAHKFPEQKFPFVIALSAKRDCTECLSPLLNIASHFYLTTAENGRGMDPRLLQDTLLSLGFPQDRIFLFSHPRQAVQKAKTDFPFFVVTGTFYIMKDALEAIS